MKFYSGLYPADAGTDSAQWYESSDGDDGHGDGDDGHGSDDDFHVLCLPPLDHQWPLWGMWLVGSCSPVLSHSS